MNGRPDPHSSSVRAQAFTLEALVAAVLLLASVVFALQMTAVTAESTSTANQHATNQLRSVAEGALDVAVENGSVSSTLRYWNETEGRFHGVTHEDGYYVDVGPPTALGRELNRSLADRGVVFTADLWYLTPDGDRRRVRLVSGGSPSDDAVRVSRTVTILDDDPLLDERGRSTNVTVGNASTFYAPDADPDGPVYNVVRLEVVAWRV